MNTLVTLALPVTVSIMAMLQPSSVSAQDYSASLPAAANVPEVRAAMSACSGDVQNFCPAVQPGGGRIVRCLAANQDKISTGCRDSMVKARTALGM